MNEFASKISEHINDLVILGKALSDDANIEALEKEGLNWLESEPDFTFWQGAEIKVVSCIPGSNYNDWVNELY